MTKKRTAEIIDGLSVEVDTTENTDTEDELLTLDLEAEEDFNPNAVLEGPSHLIPNVPGERRDPYCTSKGSKKSFSRMNITEKLYQMKCHPVETLAMISMMDEIGLNLPAGKHITIREAIDASKVLMSYIAAPQKPQDAPQEEEEFQPILTYLPKRAVPEEFMEQLEQIEADKRLADEETGESYD